MNNVELPYGFPRASEQHTTTHFTKVYTSEHNRCAAAELAHPGESDDTVARSHFR